MITMASTTTGDAGCEAPETWPTRSFITMFIIITIIIVSSSSSSSSSSTQRSNRGPVDEMHVFQKQVFSPRPEATCQVNFNAKTHLFNLKCKKEMAVA